MNKKYIIYGSAGLFLVILIIFLTKSKNIVVARDIGGQTASPYTPFSASYNAPNLVPISPLSLGLPVIGNIAGQSSGGCNMCDTISRIINTPSKTPAKMSWADTVNGWYSSIGRKKPDTEGINYWINKLALGQATYTDFTEVASGVTSGDTDTLNARDNAIAIRRMAV